MWAHNLFLSSTAVVRPAVNRGVVGSNPTSGAYIPIVLMVARQTPNLKALVRFQVGLLKCSILSALGSVGNDASLSRKKYGFDSR